LVSAARTAFAELGADAPFAEIARRAGVGTATLYRRFPTREDLLEFVFEDRIQDCAATVDAYLAQAQVDPWGAFSGYIRDLFALQREDRAFSTVLLGSFPGSSRMEHERQRAMTGLTALVNAAHAAGVLRTDFQVGDIELLLRAHDGVLAHTDRSGAASEQLSVLLLDGCRVSGMA
ncbi:MAG: TetR/AcrR family transcriptional regulator, partial [Propionibacteriaceae bacterium]|nr:TetR/AcrR family transcriptional regulator [Propionibacteriaceae bacterium]